MRLRILKKSGQGNLGDMMDEEEEDVDEEDKDCRFLKNIEESKNLHLQSCKFLKS